MVSKVSVGMSTINIHLPQFKIQGHLQKTRTMNHGTSELIPKEKKRLTFLPLHSPFDLFLIKNNALTKLPS